MHALNRLIDILNLTEISPNLFMGKNENIGLTHVFGGQIIAQSLSAAMRIVETPRVLHACYATFLQSGDLDTPLYYQTEILREGNSFSVININVIQKAQRICQITASFQVQEQGLNYQVTMPSVLQPEKLHNESQYIQQISAYLPSPFKEIWQKERAFDVQLAHLNNPFQGKKLPAEQTIWARLNGTLTEQQYQDQRLQQCLVAYFSDFHCIQTMLHPHKIGIMQQNLRMATLNHNLYFHREINFNDWLLFKLQNTNANGARGLTTGQVFSKDGRLLMSYQQEGLIRII